MLGMSNLGGELRGAYAAFSKAAELNPGHVQARSSSANCSSRRPAGEAMEKAELVLRADPETRTRCS